jgi:3-hydroxymyristoyl/3-hydroxydecanoyl-(acyl carrier protein) dehydratase
VTTHAFAWTVPADHPAFAGHFPGNPIVPGVVLLDRALLFAATLLPAPARNWRVGNAKFLAPAGPGCVLTFELWSGPASGLAFRIRSGERDIATGTLIPDPP